jgi:hypothetical protein
VNCTANVTEIQLLDNTYLKPDANGERRVSKAQSLLEANGEQNVKLRYYSREEE